MINNCENMMGCEVCPEIKRVNDNCDSTVKDMRKTMVEITGEVKKVKDKLEHFIEEEWKPFLEDKKQEKRWLIGIIVGVVIAGLTAWVQINRQISASEATIKQMDSNINLMMNKMIR